MFNLDKQYELLKSSPDKVYQKWRNYSEVIGKRIILSVAGAEVEGIAQDFDENGFLIIRTDSGTCEKYMSGTIKKVYK